MANRKLFFLAIGASALLVLLFILLLNKPEGNAVDKSLQAVLAVTEPASTTHHTIPPALETPLWGVANTPEDIQIPGAQNDIAGAVQVLLDTQILHSLKNGDLLSIYIPQSKTDLKVRINKVQIHGNNIKVIHAQQLIDANPASLVLTLGKKNTFANLLTRDGNYELVGNTRVGWLMPTINMDQHVDFSKPDYKLLDGIGRLN